MSLKRFILRLAAIAAVTVSAALNPDPATAVAVGSAVVALATGKLLTTGKK